MSFHCIDLYHYKVYSFRLTAEFCYFFNFAACPSSELFKHIGYHCTAVQYPTRLNAAFLTSDCLLLHLNKDFISCKITSDSPSVCYSSKEENDTKKNHSFIHFLPPESSLSDLLLLICIVTRAMVVSPFSCLQYDLFSLCLATRQTPHLWLDFPRTTSYLSVCGYLTQYSFRAITFFCI